MVSEICKYLEGNFCVVSNNDYILTRKEEKETGKTSFNGTGISMRLKSDAIHNAREIISTIASRGESEAKTIRNAFKEASIPSRGLMTQLNIVQND